MGTSPLGHAYGTPDEKEALAAIKEAFDLGINFWDTAPFYGAGSAERLLGHGLRDLPRDQVVVSTKVGKYAPGQPADFSAARVTRSVTESLERLGLDYIDVIQVHDVEYADDLKQIINDTLPALAKLRKEGVVRYVGFSGLPLDAFTYILDRAPAGLVDVVLSYCHNTLNDRTLLPLLPYFKSKGVGVISASFSSMGMFTKQGAADWHPAPKPVMEAAAAARRAAEARGVDIGTLAIKESVAAPGVAVHLMGMKTVAEVRVDVRTMLEALGLAESPQATAEAEAAEEVRSILALHMDVTWPTGNPHNRT
ncbi:hypothetical protein WJX81_006924 [Elliptochloris bilobata]|uniref:NADP-dependent oxidoreductase domain-containing protein n=1 Tax=Elliptochloris bilobata TaxID=381761 RepID=A0AAW1RGB0_9CHLO